MTFLAMSFGPPLEFIYAFALLVLAFLIFIILFAGRILFKGFSWKRNFIATFGIPLSIPILILVFEFLKSPMTVRKYHLDGSFVINRNLFKGDNTNWRYDHYWVTIFYDTLTLHVMNNGREIKQYKKPITYRKNYKESALSLTMRNSKR